MKTKKILDFLENAWSDTTRLQAKGKGRVFHAWSEVTRLQDKCCSTTDRKQRCEHDYKGQRKYSLQVVSHNDLMMTNYIIMTIRFKLRATTSWTEFLDLKTPTPVWA